MIDWYNELKHFLRTKGLVKGIFPKHLHQLINQPRFINSLAYFSVRFYFYSSIYQ